MNRIIKKITRTIAIFALFGYSVAGVAQVSISEQTNHSPHESALLDLIADDKGLLIPRVELTDLNDDTSPIANPATGLLVYNSSGSLERGFYYWDGNSWTIVGSDVTPSDCVTLNQAYGCNQPGEGRYINATNGSVEITLPSDASGDIALEILTNKGTTANPSSGIEVENSAHGGAIFAELTDPTNPYGAIQGIVNSSLDDGNLPTGVSGYHFGSGEGVGVWGQVGSSASGGSSGLYGSAEGGDNFGAFLHSEDFAGLHVQTGNPSGQAMQVQSAGANPLNPAMLLWGWSQITCGNTGAAYGNAIIFNNAGGEASMVPDHGEFGMIGKSTAAWWELHYYNAYQASKKERKRDIKYINETKSIDDFIMADIERLRPAFYKHKGEYDKITEGKEHRTRYSKRLGFMVDDKETPDYIKNNTFDAIDTYGLTTLAVAGVQHNRRNIVEIKEIIEKISTQITDFGIASINGNESEVRINYNKDFKGNTPVVSVTPNSPVSKYYIKEQDENGFTLAFEGNESFDFNWTANANHKVETVVEKKPVYNIDKALKSQLRIDESKKQHIRSVLSSDGQKAQPRILELKETMDYSKKPKIQNR